MKTDLLSSAVFLGVLCLSAPAHAQTSLATAEQALQAGDGARAVEILEELAAAGDAQAALRLGLMYRDGDAVLPSNERARGYLEQAARSGSADAQNALGGMLLSSGDPQSVASALNWLEAAAREGQAQAQFEAGAAIETFQPDRLGDAIEYYEAAASQSYAPAMTSLGVLALEGRGIARNPQTAQEFFAQAAVQGDARAANNLGLMLSRGEDVERDYERAAAYFQAAAAQGLPAALRNLSVMYENGFGVEVNEALAVELLAQARQIETPNLSVALQEFGFPFDIWLVEPDWQRPLDPREEQAAQSGDPVALYRTAFRYLFGLGVRTDVDLALLRFEAAANAGLGSAALSLGLLYANGSAVPQSYRQAYVWFGIAHQLGVDAAGRLRDLVGDRMTADSLRSAQEELQRAQVRRP